MRRYLGRTIIGVSLVAALVTGLAILLVLKTPSQIDAAARVQRAQVQADALADQLVPGKALHVRYENYRRHGPVAAQIAAMAQRDGDPVEFYPERYYADTWLVVVAEGNLVSDERWVVAGVDGATYARGFVRDGQKVEQWLRAGTEESSPFTTYSARQVVLGLSRLAENLPNWGFRLVGEGLWEDERETAIFEGRSPLELRPRSPGQTGISLPYLDDLDPKELVRRIEIVLDNPMINHSQQWVVDAQGKSTLIEVKKTVLVEIIDESAIPK